MKFKGFKLDRFQEESINSIENNHSVVVSAATGTGKTLIADFVIDKYLNQGKRIIYTAPIKALSNQKYADFKRQYGEDKVGIMTGDVTINHEAPLRIMTTEIYRNMLLANDPDLDDVAYIVFDEIHYLGDFERGTVWEESIIFSKEHTRFLCLSATIPNAKQFANWISFIKKHNVDVVTEKKRAVPLHQTFYDSEKGFTKLSELKELKKLEKIPKYKYKRRRFFEELKRKRKLGHLDLMQEIKDKLPAIYFCFSRMETQKKAILLSKKNNYLNNDEALQVSKIVRERLKETDESVLNLDTTRTLREILSKGIGFHHAGILPVLKEIVETLFSKGLIKVLFATETFSVGINMPAKTVVFDSMEKFDGINFRYINSKEFFQLAGRAGRRGIDKQGFVIVNIERTMMDLNTVERIVKDDKEPLKSQFKLSFNTILNLVHSHTEQEQEVILESNFYAYQQAGRKGSNRIKASFQKKKKKLFKEGYIVQGLNGPELTEKGLFSMRIYNQELLVGELFTHKNKNLFTNKEILLFVGRICYEERKNHKFNTKSKEISTSAFKKVKDNTILYNYFRKNQLFLLENFLMNWYDGCDFGELLEYSNLPEGDVVRYVRQVLDLLQQIQHATLDDDLKAKVRQISDKIDRDVISVRF
ncbi:MAG: DEAD/DEAH box helicase [Candidatus Woesearchaeota archaeon]